MAHAMSSARTRSLVAGAVAAAAHQACVTGGNVHYLFTILIVVHVVTHRVEVLFGQCVVLAERSYRASTFQLQWKSVTERAPSNQACLKKTRQTWKKARIGGKPIRRKRRREDKVCCKRGGTSPIPVPRALSREGSKSAVSHEQRERIRPSRSKTARDRDQEPQPAR